MAVCASGFTGARPLVRTPALDIACGAVVADPIFMDAVLRVLALGRGATHFARVLPDNLGVVLAIRVFDADVAAVVVVLDLVAPVVDDVGGLEAFTRKPREVLAVPLVGVVLEHAFAQ